MKLSELCIGGRAVIVKIDCGKDVTARLRDFGFESGAVVRAEYACVFGGPVVFAVRGMNVAIRRCDCDFVEIAQI